MMQTGTGIAEGATQRAEMAPVAVAAAVAAMRKTALMPANYGALTCSCSL